MKKFLFLLAIPIVIAAIYFGGQLFIPNEMLVAEPTFVVIKPGSKTREVALRISPTEITQGDPALIEIDGIETVSDVESLTFNGKKISVFQYGNSISALVGVDLRMKKGTYPLVLKLGDKRKIQKDLVVGERVVVREQFDIPEKLGGNTVESEAELLKTLNDESGIISAVPSTDQMLWSEPFGLPLEGDLEVTDTYGYSRLTATAALSHKGTDYRADIGTRVVAINSGRISYIGFLRNYGNTVIIDHGQGLQSLYLHLSQIDVKVGDDITKGQQLGFSGDTGYVLGPHLHLSVRIHGVSIDPEKFLALFGN